MAGAGQQLKAMDQFPSWVCKAGLRGEKVAKYKIRLNERTGCLMIDRQCADEPMEYKEREMDLMLFETSIKVAEQCYSECTLAELCCVYASVVQLRISAK